MALISIFLSTITTYNSSNPLAAILLVFFTALVVFLLIPIIFHHRNWRNAPPGPYGWPILGYLPYLTGGNLHATFLHLSKTYGPFYSLRVGQKPAIIITSPEVAREILNERWRLLRKILTTELFSSRAIQLLQPARQQQVHILLKSLYDSSKSKTLVNISESLLVATTNLTSNLVCSKSLFGNIEVRKCLAASLRKFAFDELIDERLEERKKGIKINENERLDLLDVFLDYKIEGNDDCFKQFSRVDIKGVFIVSMLL
ncbi:hypothetical protein NE237_011054 [Protea cynaroides]|uniref:Cytochrome P450 n=1 Tax=Protea cynaroides TaxID=273540 RepID=A0A9Q0JWE6_9MAGN|nr:hypothetical protein NE237_011054 [Protea cynaroides]